MEQLTTGTGPRVEFLVKEYLRREVEWAEQIVGQSVRVQWDIKRRYCEES